MRQLRAGIIGLGRSGRDIHGAALARMNDRYRIVGVADLIADRRDRARDEYECDAYADYRELIARDDLDFVVNATPSHLHVSTAVDVLESGHHCVTEKPFAPDLAGADRIIAAAGAGSVGPTLAVFQQSRFAPYFEKVREVIASGVLGRVSQINISFNGFSRRYDWQTLQECAGGNLLNTGPHPLDQALQLFGADEEPRVHCVMDRVNSAGDAEDHVLLILSGEASPTIRLEISSCAPYPVPVYTVYAEHGGLTGTMDALEWKYLPRPLATEKPKLDRRPLRHADGTPAYPREELEWVEERWTAPQEEGGLFATISRRFYETFHATLTEGAPLVVTSEEVRRQIAVIEECRRQNPRIYGR
jgi:predicted dehydrogenase